MAAKKKTARKKSKAKTKPRTGVAAQKKRAAVKKGVPRKSAAKKAAGKKSPAGKGAGKAETTRRAAKKKPTKKSAKKKAAKKKPVALRKRPVTPAKAAQPAAVLSVPEAPRPVSIPGAWPFPVGNRP